MEEVSTENAKVSDSGYSNTCSNSQSQRSSGSSISRNSNRSESSGYCGRRPSTFGSSNEALPQPISKRKDKEYKKKKSKTILAVNAEADIILKSAGTPPEAVSYNVTVPTKPILEKKSENMGRYVQEEQNITTRIFVGCIQEEVAIELVDATDPGEHNGDNVTDVEVGLASRTNPLDDSASQANEGFCAVISMHDGLVLYTTPSICTALGYPKDAWIGRSFIDYVHPKDKATLADQISSSIVSPQEDRPKGINGRRASLFCGLRKFTRSVIHQSIDQHKAARSNFYLPFHLTLSFRDFRDRATEQQHKAMFLVVTAQPVHSAYKAPEETIISSVFTTRHTATCYLSHVDPDVVQYFGYLPQDMVGRSLFDFYHPEDLPFIKDIYETVIKLEGASFRSKPYRFGVQNGGYVVLETEWSSFINPWTKKLEFVVGQHRVLKGPANPDIFRLPCATEYGQLANISEEVLKEAKIIQGEIRTLLDENIQRKSDITELDVSKRCKDLASFMENLLQETRTPGLGKDVLATDDRSFSGSRNPLLQEHDSVMLGEISPHREYYDSKSSTETPPSYNQLNYNENIERFFKSKPPVATMYGSDEENINSSNDEGEKTSPNSAVRKCMSPINGSGGSGSGSAENLSSGSNNQTSSASRGNTSNTTSTESFKPPTLTESLLNRHNEDMEKLMMQKHRELRSSIKASDKLKDSRIKTTEKMSTDPNMHFISQGHGVKRSGSHSWEGDSFKVSKHDEVSRTSTAGQFPTNVTTTVTSMSVDQSTVIQKGANINLWQPLSVTVPPASPAQPHNVPQNTNSQAIPRVPILPPMIPVYYIPVPQTNDPAVLSSLQEKLSPPHSMQPPQPNPYISYVTTAMAGVIYPPVIGAPSAGMMYRPFLIPEQTSVTRENNQSTMNKCSDRKRPASQATSVKAEPGSSMAMSESSKKVLSPGELFSSCVSNDGGCSSLVDAPTPVNQKIHKQNDYSVDESSSSSFYSSFLYKSSDSSCNPDQKPTEYLPEESMMKQHYGKRRKEPPWLEGVQLTPELIYEYQIHPKTLNEVLQADMDALKNFNQPLLVNDQLGQLYLDLEVEGFETKLVLEDGITSSGSDSGSSSGSWTAGTMSQQKHRRRMVKYGKLVMIHEENAPLPPALPPQSVPCQQL
ncbi:period circadian regulator isoform X2 [Bombus vancouverensis nearcticus]|uniref:Period circadian protein n=1 Tax=Bombus impatiens TaxID=132113 RepID=A0A6P6FIT0_BOMIM|nr:period circadian protein isoform X2 [Bombus impatiens]XP_033190495.1 period circadian protein isoform X2 [Bombus vancouverensis nearcticus]